MPVVEKSKKTRCPLCGAKNPVGARRCGICTRPLAHGQLPTQAVYEEALWATRIASKGTRAPIKPLPVLALVIVGAVILNYFVLGFGPSWAHEAPEAVPSADWKVYRGQPEYVVDLPGEPMVATATAMGRQLTTATVWVDGRWSAVRDANTQAAGKLETARITAHAALVTATGDAPDDPAASMSAVTASLLPGVVLEPGGVSSVQDPPPGQQRLELVTNYSGFPEPSDHGVVRATATIANGRIWVDASFVRDGDDAALHRRLDEHYEPNLG